MTLLFVWAINVHFDLKIVPGEFNSVGHTADILSWELSEEAYSIKLKLIPMGEIKESMYANKVAKQ